MTALILDPDNRADILASLSDDTWMVACLCAAWCDVCKTYRPAFDALAIQHPDKRFVWVDIEDRADIVGDLDIENFPTLLLQRGDTVAFFGTVQPDIQVANRLLTASSRKSAQELQAEADSNDERQRWQQECNLRRRLQDAQFME
jgi:thioredoxin-like negative regulator of GroEL